MSTLLDELKLVQKSLLPSFHRPLPSLPTLQPEEVPERERDYSKESLLEFAAEKDRREHAEREAAAGAGEGFGGFGGFGGGKDKEKKESDKTAQEERKVEAEGGSEEVYEDGAVEESVEEVDQGGQGAWGSVLEDQPPAQLSVIQEEEQVSTCRYCYVYMYMHVHVI